MRPAHSHGLTSPRVVRENGGLAGILIAVRARLDAGRRGEAGGDQTMDRGWIEDELRRHFGPARAGLSSALSEVKACLTFPDCLAGVLREMGPGLTPVRAILAWAVRRGDLWR